MLIGGGKQKWYIFQQINWSVAKMMKSRRESRGTCLKIQIKNRYKLS